MKKLLIFAILLFLILTSGCTSQQPQQNQTQKQIIEKFSEKSPNVKFYISLHPDLDRKKYEQRIKKSKIILWDDSKGKGAWLEQVKKSDFLVVHNTTMALESLKFQFPIFRYKDKTFAKMIIPKRNFSNLKEFEKLISGLKGEKNFAADYYKAYLHNFYQPEGRSIPENYRKIIELMIR